MNSIIRGFHRGSNAGNLAGNRSRPYAWIVFYSRSKRREYGLFAVTLEAQLMTTQLGSSTVGPEGVVRTVGGIMVVCGAGDAVRDSASKMSPNVAKSPLATSAPR